MYLWKLPINVIYWTFLFFENENDFLTLYKKNKTVLQSTGFIRSQNKTVGDRTC